MSCRSVCAVGPVCPVGQCVLYNYLSCRSVCPVGQCVLLVLYVL